MSRSRWEASKRASRCRQRVSLSTRTTTSSTDTGGADAASSRAERPYRASKRSCKATTWCTSTTESESTSGMTRVEADGRLVDCVVVDYAEGGKLYVPSDEMDRLQKYVGKDGTKPRLNKLGGVSWAKAKAKATEAVAKLARELLGLYAARKARPGHAFGADVVWQQELETSFIYEETEDQLRATEEIKTRHGVQSSDGQARVRRRRVREDRSRHTRGLQGRHGRQAGRRARADDHSRAAAPHDLHGPSCRLPGRDRRPLQVQNAEGAEATCSNASPRARSTSSSARTGSYQKDVKFNDLGLLVIDEEQQFGVLHKETIQKMRKIGRRHHDDGDADPADASHVSHGRARHVDHQHAARDRLPVRTEMAAFDDDLIVEAVMREIDRGGQVYFVHNRVQTIEGMATLPQGPPARVRHRRRPRPDARTPARVGHDEVPGGADRRARLQHDHRIRPRHSERQHDHHQPGGPLRTGPALSASRACRSFESQGLRLPADPARPRHNCDRATEAGGDTGVHGPFVRLQARDARPRDQGRREHPGRRAARPHAGHRVQPLRQAAPERREAAQGRAGRRQASRRPWISRWMHIFPTPTSPTTT